MLKKVLVTSISAIALVCMLSAVAPAQDGNARKGKSLFRKTCRECHKEDATATPLSPDSKTQDQWTRAFEPENYQALQCKDEWAKHSEEDLADIYTYLYEHAYDSPSPAKCK